MTSSHGSSAGGNSSWVNRAIVTFIVLGVFGFILSFCSGMSQQQKRIDNAKRAAVESALKAHGIQGIQAQQATPTQAPPANNYAAVQNAPQPVASANGNGAQASFQGPQITLLSIGGGAGGASRAAQAAPDVPPEQVIDQSPPPLGVQKITAPPVSDAADPNASANYSAWQHLHQVKSGTALVWKDLDLFRSGALREQCVDYFSGEVVDTQPWVNHYCRAFRIGSTTGKPIETAYKFVYTSSGG